MPELPEVEQVARQLNEVIAGQKIVGFEVYRKKNVPASKKVIQEKVIGQIVLKVFRRAKVIIIELDNEYFLTIHLRMTGQLFVKKKSEQVDSYTRARIIFKDKALWFRDIRAFGRIELLSADELHNKERSFGPEPLESEFTFDVFNAILAKKAKRAIKPLLLDQAVIAGIGNIYANEALYITKIHPLEKAGNISRPKKKALYTALRDILKKAVDLGGCSDNTYRDIYNKKGLYNTFLKVYRKEGSQCLQCEEAEIQRIVVAQRGTFICPNCQRN